MRWWESTIVAVGGIALWDMARMFLQNWWIKKTLVSNSNQCIKCKQSFCLTCGRISMQKTLAMVKPDGVKHNVIGSFLSSIERTGLQITHLEIRQLTLEECEKLYIEHKEQWYFERNVKHVSSGPVVLIIVEGDEAVVLCRQTVERFRQDNADLIELPRNLVHATSALERVDDELSAVGLNRA